MIYKANLTNLQLPVQMKLILKGSEALFSIWCVNSVRFTLIGNLDHLESSGHGRIWLNQHWVTSLLIKGKNVGWFLN